MVDYKQILRLRAEGVSQRGIADVLGCSRNTVAAVFTAATAVGVGFGQVADLGADEVRGLLLPDPVAVVSDRAVPDFEYVHRELGRPSVTLLLLWNEYAAKCRETGQVPYQYSFFNEQYRRWVKATGASMRIPRSPGESVEVDWAGDAMATVDPVTGQPVDAFLFVAALSFSAYTYVEAFADMTLGSWIEGHVHAFEYFGGYVGVDSTISSCWLSGWVFSSRRADGLAAGSGTSCRCGRESGGVAGTRSGGRLSGVRGRTLSPEHTAGHGL